MDVNTTDGTTDNLTGRIHVGDLPEGPQIPSIGTIDNTPVDNTWVQDPWKHRSEGMKCKTCMFYVNFRCRRHAPTMQGYPAVYPDDWCGDHKLDKVKMGGV